MGAYYDYRKQGGNYVQVLMHDPLSDGFLLLMEYAVPGSPRWTDDAVGWAFRAIVLMPQIKSATPVKAVLLDEMGGTPIAAMDLSLPVHEREIEWFADLLQGSREMLDASIEYTKESKKQNLPFV